MHPSPHRIRRQRWLVRTHSTAAAQSWRIFLARQGQDLVLPLFEQAFAEIGGDGRSLHLPRLELHLTLNDVEPSPESLAAAILAQLREHLEPLRQSLVQADASRDADPGLDSGRAAGQFDLLLYYLRTGFLPWPAAGLPDPHPKPDLAAIIQGQWPELLQHLPRRPETPAFYWRLLHLLPETLRRSLLTSMLAPESGKALEICLALLETDTPTVSPSARLQFIAALLSDILGRHGPFSLDLSTLIPAELPPAVRAALHKFTASLVPSPVAARQQESSGSAEAGTTFPSQSGSAADAWTRREPSGQSTVDYETSTPFRRASEAPPLEPELLPVLVPQAGLILLHPFFPRFLEQTGVITGGATSLSALARPRAAALLHFLATGEDEVYEYELGLIKILLGLPLSTPLLVPSGCLPPEAADEAEALLQSVIEHWSVLKNTSIPGLRSAFLQRPGLLRQHQQGWLLQIESRPFDMLLEHLPWSISIIRLPWMTETIFTEWMMP